MSTASRVLQSRSRATLVLAALLSLSATGCRFQVAGLPGPNGMPLGPISVDIQGPPGMMPPGLGQGLLPAAPQTGGTVPTAPLTGSNPGQLQPGIPTTAAATPTASGTLPVTPVTGTPTAVPTSATSLVTPSGQTVPNPSNVPATGSLSV